MSRGIMVAVCALALIGGCKDKDKDDKGKGGGTGEVKDPPPKPDAKSRAPAPPGTPAKITLDPEPTAPEKLPPPEMGYARIAHLDLDVKATKATGDASMANIEAGACFPRVAVDIAEIDADAYLAQLGTKKVIRKEARPDGWLLEYTSEGSPDSQLVIAGKIGATRFVCDTYVDSKREGSLACAEEVCGSLRVVAGGTLAKPYPAGEPVIATFSGGGIDGGSRGGVNLWEDGTLHFHGPKCKQWRGRTGKVDAAAMTALIDAFRAGDVSKIPEEPDDGGSDCVGIGLRVRLDGKTHGAGHSGCNEHIDPTLEDLFGWIGATAGANPCQY